MPCDPIIKLFFCQINRLEFDLDPIVMPVVSVVHNIAENGFCSVRIYIVGNDSIKFK